MCNVVLEIGATATGEYINVQSITAAGGEVEITLRSPLLADLANGAQVQVIDIPGMVTAAPGTIPTLETGANAGDGLLYSADAATFNASDVAVIDDTTGSNFEIRRVGQLGFLSADVGAYDSYPATSNVQLVEGNAILGAGTSSSVFNLTAAGAFTAGMSIAVTGNAALANT